MIATQSLDLTPIDVLASLPLLGTPSLKSSCVAPFKEIL